MNALTTLTAVQVKTLNNMICHIVSAVENEVDENERLIDAYALERLLDAISTMSMMRSRHINPEYIARILSVMEDAEFNTNLSTVEGTLEAIARWDELCKALREIVSSLPDSFDSVEELDERVSYLPNGQNFALNV